MEFETFEFEFEFEFNSIVSSKAEQPYISRQQ